jgi:hypothetical protein
MTEGTLVPVSMRALIARINRKLKADDEKLCATRERWRGNLGDYFIVSLTSNIITCRHVDVEELARDIGVLRACERLA